MYFLPWAMEQAFPDVVKSPFLMYSPVNSKFIFSETEDSKTVIYDLTKDKQYRGKEYTKEERDRMLPQQYYNVLAGRDELPDSICGKEVSAKIFKESSWTFVCNPRDVNKVQPEVYLIMESMPKRLELEDANQVFRMKSDGIELVDIKTNKVVSGKSERFTTRLRQAGFAFPAIDLHANITTRKPYDEGYLMIDSRHRLFHVKQQAGRPYVKKISLSDSIVPDKVFITENTNHRFLGLFTDTKHRLYVINSGSYSIQRIPTEWNPRKERIMIMTNIFNWIVNTSDTQCKRWYAIDNDSLSLLDTYSRTAPKTFRETVDSYLFPVELRLTSPTDQFVYPRITIASSFVVLYVNMLLALLFFLFGWKEKPMVDRLVGTGYVAIFGICGMIPLILFRN